MKLKISKTKQQVAIDFSEYLVDFISNRESAHIALSGGSTPKIVFDELANTYKNKIDWSKVYLYWGDERCVPPIHEESNYGMTVDHLISQINIPKTNVHRIMGENLPEKEAVRYGELLMVELPTVNNIPQFDLVILGMGDDGHTASIFPHQINLWDSDKICEVAEHPHSSQKRITITGKVINNAAEIAFLVTGDSKSEKVGEIINKEEGYLEYPASLVNPTTGKLVWFLDKAAASELS